MPSASALGSVVNAEPESAGWSLTSSRYVASSPANSLALNELVQCSLPMCVQYLVHYEGYGKEHDEWHPGSEMAKTDALDKWEDENGTEV